MKTHPDETPEIIDFPFIVFPTNTAIKYAVENKITAKQGDIYEDIFYNDYLIKSQVNFKYTGKWSQLDFIATTDKTNIFIELKSRNINIETYKETIIPISKIKYFNKLSSLNKDKNNRLFLVFAYGCTEDKQFYYLKYEPNLFKTFTTKDIFGKSHYLISTEYLKPISDIYDKLATY
jgi:Holliday junction resolvase-like predicted endonuclease